jgi:molecular chaperone DnaK
LSKDEVDRMMREAESHADEDKRRKEEIETRNQADQAVYAAEKFLSENGDKVPADARGGIDAAVSSLKEAIEKSDTAAMKQGLEALMQAQHKAAEAMYRSTGGPTEPGAGPETAGSASSTSGGDTKDGVIDAEVVDEK